MYLFTSLFDAVATFFFFLSICAACFHGTMKVYWWHEYSQPHGGIVAQRAADCELK